MAKAPIVGKVKTGLCPPLGPQSAAMLHESFIRDAVEKASTVPDAEVVVAYSPRGTAPYFREITPGADRYLFLRGDTPGERLSHCFEHLCGPDSSVIVMGSDAPTLPLRCIEMAFGVLDTGRADAVIGPASERGYYLVGLRSPVKELFEDVVWSGPNAIPGSASRARQMGLRVHLLPEWYYVDRPADLSHLRAELLDRAASTRSARHTRERMRSFIERGLL